ncbi:phage tail tape measure protein, partial [bacterium]
RFIKGLAQMKKEGGNVIGTLTDLGLGERRTRSTILALAGNTELLERALKQSSTAWKENTALARESGIRYKTTASQLKIATNNLTDFGITVGASVVPPLVSLLHKADPLLDKFRALDKTAQENTVKWVALGGAGLLVAGRLKGLVDTALLARTVMLGLAAARARDTASLAANTGALGTNTAALGANSAAAGANAGAVGAAGAAATEAGAGAASGAVGIGAFGVAFGIASAAAIVATTAIGLYKINQEKIAQNNAKVEASNAGLTFSNKGVSASFDALTKSAKGNGEAATSVSKLRNEYEKLSKTDLKKFSVASLPKARANISLNTRLTNSDKDALLYQLDGLQARVKDQLAAKKITIEVKAEANKGALDNLKSAFYDTYGNLYDGWKTVFLHPTVDSAKWAFGQIGYVAKTSFDGVAKGMVDLRKGLSDAWYSLTGGFESGFNRMLRGL